MLTQSKWEMLLAFETVINHLQQKRVLSTKNQCMVSHLCMKNCAHVKDEQKIC